MHPLLYLYVLHAADLLPRLRAAGIDGDPTDALREAAREDGQVTLGPEHDLHLTWTSQGETFTATFTGPAGFDPATYRLAMPTEPLSGEAARQAARLALASPPLRSRHDQHPDLTAERYFAGHGTTAEAAVSLLEFSPYHTGGGCMALYAEFPWGDTLLLTLLDGVTMPRGTHEGLMLGIYPPDDSDHLLCLMYPAQLRFAVLDDHGRRVGTAEGATTDEPDLNLARKRQAASEGQNGVTLHLAPLLPEAEAQGA